MTKRGDAKRAKRQEEWDKTIVRQGRVTDAEFERQGGRPKVGETSGKTPRLGIRKKK